MKMRGEQHETSGLSEFDKLAREMVLGPPFLQNRDCGDENTGSEPASDAAREISVLEHALKL